MSSGGEDLVYGGHFVVFACLGRRWIYDKCHSRLVYSGRIGRPWCRSISFFFQLFSVNDFGFSKWNKCLEIVEKIQLKLGPPGGTCCFLAAEMLDRKTILWSAEPLKSEYNPGLEQVQSSTEIFQSSKPSTSAPWQASASVAGEIGRQVSLVWLLLPPLNIIGSIRFSAETSR